MKELLWKVCKCDLTAALANKNFALIPWLCSYAKAAITRLPNVSLLEEDLVSEQTLHNLTRWQQVRL